MATVLPLDQVTDLVIGTTYELTVEAWTNVQYISGQPSGMTMTYTGMGYIGGLKGAPNTEGDYTVYVDAVSGPMSQVPLTVRPEGWEPPPVVEVEPAPPLFTDEPPTLTIPSTDGVAYLLDGVLIEAGAHDMDSGTAVLVQADALDGYVLTGTSEWSHEYPAAAGGEDSPEYLAYLDATALTVAAMMGQSERPGQTELAAHCVDVITQYAVGFTRARDGIAGRGFTAAGVPLRPVRAVIVTAALRLTSNPRQLTYYQSGDYSERPAVMAGWTVAELATIRRYRQRSA